MNKLILVSLLVAVVTAVPTRFENEEAKPFRELVSVSVAGQPALANELIPVPPEVSDILYSPMDEFELDYELNKEKYENYEILPDPLRRKIVEKLRKLAVRLKFKILDLIHKIDKEIDKLEDGYSRTSNPVLKGKVWAQINSLKLLKTVTLAGLDKFDRYIISENSTVLENLIRALEKLFEAKFFNFTTLAKVTISLLKMIYGGS